MKKLFTLVALTLVAAISFSVSAQSSKFIGKWNTSSGAQAAMIEAVGGTIEEVKNTMTFNNDNTYTTYTYTEASADVMGVRMHMLFEYSEHGTWKYSNETIYLTSYNLDIKQFDITFDDASFNVMSGEIKTAIVDTLKQGLGMEVSFDVEFISDNEIYLSFNNGIIPLEYTLTR